MPPRDLKNSEEIRGKVRKPQEIDPGLVDREEPSTIAMQVPE
jgi:hypothetical protein